MHHEVELGVVIGKNGRDIPKTEAESYIAGYSELLVCIIETYASPSWGAGCGAFSPCCVSVGRRQHGDEEQGRSG